MWLLTLLMALITLLIAWTCFGYFLVARLAGLMRRRPVPPPAEQLPVISVIVPCYNERANLPGRLANLIALDYPDTHLEIVFADGGSTDGSVEWLRENLPTDRPCRLVCCPQAGKIRQVNHVLPSLRGEFVVNTDADATIGVDALQRFAAWFAANPSAAVVGASAAPTLCTPMDAYYWMSQNKGRFLESDAWGVSIVIAVCYAFRRELFERFPDDVIADDIFVAFEALSRGREVLYVRDIQASELRGPTDTGELVAHKFRKANAFLRESLRFIYRLPEMTLEARTMMLTRLAQQLLLPWAVLLWLLLLGALATLFRFDLVVLDLLFLGSVFAATSWMFTGVAVPVQQEVNVTLIDKVRTYVVTLFVLMCTGATYPFFRQTSSYARVPTAAGPAGEPAVAGAATNCGPNRDNVSTSVDPADGAESEKGPPARVSGEAGPHL